MPKVKALGIGLLNIRFSRHVIHLKMRTAQHKLMLFSFHSDIGAMLPQGVLGFSVHQ